MASKCVVFRLILVCALTGFGAPVANAADDPAAATRASLDRIQTLRKERPNDGLLIFYQALLQSELGERASVFKLLQSLKGRKLGLVPYFGSGFDKVWSDPKFQEIRQILSAEEPKTPDSPVAFRLKDPKLIPEGIAFDPKSKRFFIGSIAQRKIVVSDGKDEARDFSRPSDKLDEILGLRIDSVREQLWAVSTNAGEDSAKNERRNAIVRYDLKTGRMLDRVPAPDAMQLNDLAVAEDGLIYVTDSESGTLFRWKPGESIVARLGAAGGLRGANGITIGSDGTLYVTLSTGIARVNTVTGEPTRLPQPDTVVTGGIDGLYWHEGNLLGIQNGPNPGRVIQISLADKGSRIAGVTVLQSHHHPAFDEPTTGAIANDALYVLGNSYVGHYQPDGTIKDASELKGTAIVAVPLRR